MNAPRLVARADGRTFRIEVTSSRFLICNADELRALRDEINEALEGNSGTTA